MLKCEILAPAGNMDALKSAVLNGADAVYIGGSSFNARASASNFSEEDLKSAVNYCHLRKVKVYVAVNILIHDIEFDELDKFIRYIDAIGADAVIVQDIGVAMYIKKIAPKLDLHASTQMTVYDKYGAEFLKNIGFKRVVLARELSMSQIKEISSNVDIELEIFVHGAMCVCYSGQCLMSSMIGGRSGNRGKCAQPCRLLYNIENKSGTLMSLKDMCLIKYIDEFKKMEIASLKIEGRMKGPDYVGTVVSIYRKYIDNSQSVSDCDYRLLENIFYRGGFSDGYISNNKGKEMFCHKKPENPYLKQKKINAANNLYKKTDLYLFFEAKKNENIKLTGIDEYGNKAEYISECIVETAKNTPTDKGKIKENLSKLNDTVFRISNIEIDISDSLFIPVSEINKSRRNITDVLEQIIIKSSQREKSDIQFDSPRGKSILTDYELSVFVSDKEQLKAVRNTDCRRIILPYELSKYADENDIIALPRISPDNIENIISNVKNRELLIRNIGQIGIAKKYNKHIHIDYTLNVFNIISADFYSNFDASVITLSTELTLNQIKAISKYAVCESVIYGRLPLMITENCLIKSSVGCRKGGYIKDRTGESFYVKCLPDCKNEIYNSKPIIMSDKHQDILYSGLSYGRIDFTNETPDECISIYNSYKNNKKIECDFTRGKFYKGV